MKCNHCNAEIPDDSRFCEFCGEKVSQYENDLLELLDKASQNDKLLAAYKARKKCYNLCKNDHPQDYKEYVDNLIIQTAPKVNEKCKVDVKFIRKLLTLLILFVIFAITAFSVHWEAFSVLDYLTGANFWKPESLNFTYSIIFAVSILICLTVLIIMAFLKKWYTKKMRQIS